MTDADTLARSAIESLAHSSPEHGSARRDRAAMAAEALERLDPAALEPFFTPLQRCAAQRTIDVQDESTSVVTAPRALSPEIFARK